MTAPDQPDPWASLAESLGVGPGGEPSREPAPPPRPAAARAATPPKTKTPAPPPASWDALAADLGIQPAAGEPPREPERRPRHDELADTADRAEPRRVLPDRGPREARGADRDRVNDHDTRLGDRAPRADDRDASSADAATGRARDGDEADRGERRGRRRRSRRGGRGRRDREPASGSPAAPLRDEETTPGFDREPRPRGAERADDGAWQGDDDASARRAVGDAADGEGSDGGGEGRGEDRPRRRGRRGRRGGRGRSRGQREQNDAPAAERTADLGDEPLPTSYGMRPAGRVTDSGDQARDQSEGRRGAGDRGGSGAARGRRRRRGGEGRGTGGAAGDSGRGRRSRRGDDGRLRSSRVARADFAPVSGSYDEDDEGLEFLGLEEAGHEPRRREPRASDDDVLAQSGLDSVREVPSWVEAIGIVIAGNLDARSRGRGDGGRHRDR